VVVLEGVRYNAQNGGTHMAVSRTGTLVYSPGVPTSSEATLAFVDGAGRFAKLGDIARSFYEPRLSPDGRLIAVVIGSGPESDLWVLDVASGTLSRLSFGVPPHRPVWTPDGRGITVGTPAGVGFKLVTFRLGEAGVPETLFETRNRAYPCAWSRDGRLLVYQERHPETGWDLHAADIEPSGRVTAGRPLVVTPFQEQDAVLSPDGRFLAYESDELDGVFDIYVRSMREDGAKVRASTTGARLPRFSAGGRLYYWYSFSGGVRNIQYHLAGERFVVDRVVPVWGGAEGGEPAVVRRLQVTSSVGFDVDPAGHRFLMLERSTGLLEPALRRPVVVLNWHEELRAQSPP
jgi:hypothetical protein